MEDIDCLCGEEEVKQEDGMRPEDFEEGEEAQEDAEEEEVECVSGGKRNERLSKIIPNLEKKSNVDVSSQISAKRGGRKAEFTEEE